MSESGVYETNVELGLWTPVPWYVEYIRMGEFLSCPPWELFEEYTPRDFWRKAARIVMLADQDAAEHRTHKASGAASPPSAGR